MQNLEKRITELEKASSIGEGATTIVVRFVTSGNLDDELQELHDWKNGQKWKRLPGETEQELEKRASSEVTRNGLGSALLMAGA